MKQTISIVVPCFNEEKLLGRFHQELLAAIELEKYNFELIFVDDGSTDDSWNEIVKLTKSNSTQLKVVGLQLTKNFGKEAAIFVGLNKSSGLAAITIDCDLQHPVDLIPAIIKLWKEKSVNVIHCVRKKRPEESFIKNIITRVYYWLLNRSTGMNLQKHTDFKLIDRKVIETYINLPEKNRFYKGLISWTGYSSYNIEFMPNERLVGDTKWGLVRLFFYAKGSILSFSFLPLKLITYLGLISLIMSFILSVHTIYNYMFKEAAEGFPTVILLLLIIGSLVLFCLGILGEYLAAIYSELKRRPKALIQHDTDNN